ncbi:MAG: prepilin-type N-terminal cleavage/methylation domain-containing protein [Patescibacteria group bacterium]|jgi:prepilin-type N-terminal cleavage/methylation domain-containing protein
MRNSKFQSGVTLIELMVSVTIFVIILLVTTQIFQMVINSQRLTIASQDMQESIRYTFDKMSKEVRMAMRDNTGLCVDAGKIYKLNAAKDELTFYNYHGRCVRYFISSGRLSRQEDSGAAQYITPPNLNISGLKYRLDGAVAGSQPRVLLRFQMMITAKGGQTQTMIVQTSLSSRFYE